MLLFIGQIQNQLLYQKGFQYITCYSLSSFMVARAMSICVSIHHMLLFICMPLPEMYRKRSFNTSHVTLYHSPRRACCNSWQVSIHHMLLFIKILGLNDLIEQSHSRSGNLGRFRNGARSSQQSFNTSHVTLYQIIHAFLMESGLFQYITCYSLSKFPCVKLLIYLVSIHHMLLFIELQPAPENHHFGVSIHHMLLFISCWNF